MKKVICIKHFEKTLDQMKNNAVYETACYTDKLYSLSQEQLMSLFAYYQSSYTDSNYAALAVCLNGEAGNKLCDSFLKAVPGAIIQHNDFLNF